MIFLLVFSLYRPGEESGGVVKAPALLTRTNFFVPIFRNFVFELSDLDTIGLLIFCTQTFLFESFLFEMEDLTRISFRVPIFLNKLFLQWLVVEMWPADPAAFRLAPKFSFSLEDDPDGESFSLTAFGATGVG